MVSLRERIQAFGHPNVSATHKSTLEVTKEPDLTREGDCIIAIAADKAARDLSEDMKNLLQGSQTRITLTIKSANFTNVIHGTGSPKLTLEDPVSMVFRKSTYISERTAMISCDKAASDLDRNLVNLLRKKSPVELVIEAEG